MCQCRRVSAVLSVLITAALLAWLVRAAPAPLARPAPPAVKPGTYETMLWRGVTCGPCHLHADGAFHLLWRGDWWEGRWRCKGGVLYVEEWPASADARVRISWSVALSSPTAGKMTDDGNEWRVAPAKGRVD